MKRSLFVKTASLILTVSMLLSFAACGPKDGSDDTTEQGVSDSDPAAGSDAVTEPNAPAVTDPGTLPVLDDWNGVEIKSSGSKEGNAVILERGASVVYDEGECKNVLKLESADGYFELPQKVFANAKDGFTVTLRVAPDGGADPSARIFQTNLCGYGIGDVQWRDAPEVCLTVGGDLRVYAGGRTIGGVYNAAATYNNGGAGDDKAYAEPNGHKTRYSANVGAITKSEWSDIAITVSPESITVYVNGTAMTAKETTEGGSGDIASTLEYLFGTYGDGEYLLDQYTNSSVGNSVYGDTANFKGMISEIRVYESALTESQISTLPDSAAYVWDFDAADIITDPVVPDVTVDLTKYMNTVDVTAVEGLSVKSPNGKNKVDVRTDGDGRLYYSITAGDTVVIENSALGFVTKSGSLQSGLSVSGIRTDSISETYEMITGPASTAKNECSELSFTASNGDGSFDFVIRVFDDGVAYRYENVTVGDGDTLTVTDEISEYVLPDRTTTWGYAPTGTYEGEYVKRSYSQLKTLSQKFSTSMLASCGDYWMMFTEAAVFNNNGDFCASALVTESGKASLGWHFGIDRDNNNKAQLGELGRPGHFDITSINTRNGFSTPWRVAVISDDLEALALSTIITDLNPDPDPVLYADTSWIKPGRVAWSWWAEENDQSNYNKHVEYIDFAAENGWEYVCLDANWRAFEPRIGELCDYAASKGVGLFVWINYLDMVDDGEMDSLFRAWSEAGVVGLKTDYFESDAQNVLDVMEKSAVYAAKYKLMILYHGCVIPYGEFRTYPNILSTEAVQGEENHKWSTVPTVENCLLYPFTRNICGPMDYTPVASRMPANGTSNGFGLAMTVVYESGLQHLANAAAFYKSYAGLSFLNELKVTWDESRLVEGYPGDYVSFARRSGEDWYLGTMTNYARTAKYKLDFLGSGEYNAYIYSDNEDGTVLLVEERKVTASDTLSFDLIDKGGAAVIITKRKIDTTVKGAEESTDPNFTYYEAESTKNVLSGAAVSQTSAFCSGMEKIGYIGYAGNTLTFNGIKADKDGTYKLRLWYCCGENRQVTVTVNGGEKYTFTGLNSGDYVHTAMAEIEIELSAGENSLEFSNSTYYAPDIDRIAVSNDTVG